MRKGYSFQIIGFRLIIFLLFTVTCTLLSTPTYADEDDGGSLPSCSAPAGIRCQEFQTSIALNWNKATYTSGSAISGVDGYQVSWFKTDSSPTCPASSPASECGSITTNSPDELNALITGLTQKQRYSFNIKIVSSNCGHTDIGGISCTPTICGDNLKGSTEACDGVDLGGQTCGPYGFSQNPKQMYEGGNLSCSSSCTINTNSCTTCNQFTQNAVSISTEPFTNNTTTPGSKFKCFVEANKQGPAIACRIYLFSNPTLGEQPLSPPINCPFKSWSGNKAEFECATPTDKTGRYRLSAYYPVSNDSTTSGYNNSDYCGYTYVQQGYWDEDKQEYVDTSYWQNTGTRSYGNASVTVIQGETIPPTVTIQETWQGDPTNLSKYKNVMIEGKCNDGGENASDCNIDSIKLKKFDLKPDSCPVDYNSYDLTGVQPASNKSTYFCATAKDNFGNIGFSEPFKLLPGCRDQCANRGDKSCTIIYPPGDGGTGHSASLICTNIDSDSCNEWSSPEQCSWKYGCFSGVCTAFKEPYGEGNVWHDKNGNNSFDKDIDSPLQGAMISYYSSHEGGQAQSNADGSFIMMAEKNASFTIKPVIPPNWKLSRTTCQYFTPNPTCSTPLVNDTSSGTDGTCNLDLGFNNQYGSKDDYCNSYPLLSYGLSRLVSPANDAPPVFSQDSPSHNPVSPHAARKVTISADATDDLDLKMIEIYADGGLIQRCPITTQLGDPKTSGSCTIKRLFAQGTYEYYAIAYDMLDQKTQTASKTLTVNAAPPPSPCYQSLPRAEGLISVGNTFNQAIKGKFGNNIDEQGVCVLDPKAAFVPFRIPTFDDLKSLYYDQKK